MSTTTEILVILLLILANGYFAMAEIALVSARKVRLQQRADDGDASAKAALELAENPNRLLSSVQVGISLVSVLTGALGGATLSDDLALLLSRVSWLMPYARSLALAIVVIVITYFSLVIGELIPKRLALNNPEKVASSVARFMRFLSWLTTPLVKVLSASTDLGLKILGVKPPIDPPVTQDEIKDLMEQGTQVGIFEESEQDMVEGVFRFGERTIDAIMTPRTEIEWIDLDEPVDEIFRQALQSTHSRLPVARENLDNVQGILVVKDLLSCRLMEKPIDIVSMLKPPIYVPDSMTAPKVLELFKGASSHVAIVIDEYGGLLGMVTLHDVFSSIVGDIPESGQEENIGIVQRDDGSWLLDGLLPIDELKELIELDDLPDETRVGYQTVGGLVMSQLGTIPTAGQHFEWYGFRFEVVDMDGRRVDKVLLTKTEPDDLAP
ncbi:MAG TPA: hemolysin family protein [Longilinea sp.]|nr:hemolysin family protein [Longilinea sp.]